MRFVGKVIAIAAWLVVLPSLAFAQASLAGEVKDASGAVLPGVTVEAASPALIEKVRSTTTDGTGQYRLVELRPGTYTVTFTLPGFRTVKREGVELSGSFTATIDAEMRVGALEETITVTGETPVVDVQSATRQRVLDQEVIDAIPSNRTTLTVATLIPGVSTSVQDVGGATGNQQGATMAIHGARGHDARITQNGISLAGLGTGGQNSATTYNLGAMQEVTIDYSAVNAELGQGGIRVNLIPKEGGNTFSANGFFNFANSSMQGSNFTQELRDRGLPTPNPIKKLWSINPSIGGPIVRDKVWFYNSYQYAGAETAVAGIFNNKNENRPDLWVYEPDTTRPAVSKTTWGDAQLRLTWQANPKNKFGVTYDRSFQCNCPGSITATTAPEAGFDRPFPYLGTTIADWSSPMTNRVLLEVVASHRWENYRTFPVKGMNPAMISVTDQFNGLTYRVRPTNAEQTNRHIYWRGALSYITGAHSFKVGFNDGYHLGEIWNTDNQPVSYRVNSVSGVPVPNQITLRATPYLIRAESNASSGIYAQDKWTRNRLTLSGGIRFDYFTSDFPEQRVGPAVLVPSRDLTLPATEGVRWRDLTPKFSMAYDVFGDGRTAVKASVNKYVAGQGLAGPFGNELNPVSRLVQQTTRNWTDANRDFVPDCNLANPLANGECAALANPAFGGAVPGASYDPETVNGWSKRPYNWELSAGVQREVLPRVSVDVSYFRRIYGNFSVIDDRTQSASDYDSYSITVPSDSRLPNGGAYAVSGLFDLNPSRFGRPADNFLTFSDNYGKIKEQWNGFDVGVSARVRGGLLLQGGTSTGRTSSDVCEVAAKVPEMLLGHASLGTANNIGAVNGGAWLPLQFCSQTSAWLTQLKGLAAYTIPRIDVQVSGAFQNMPGPLLIANYVATNAVVSPSLGRPLSGGAANTTISIVEPGKNYGERLNQLDLRVGKILRAGRARSTLSLDIYNLFNSNAVLTENSAYASWRRPTSILTARFAKVDLTFDF